MPLKVVTVTSTVPVKLDGTLAMMDVLDSTMNPTLCPPTVTVETLRKFVPVIVSEPLAGGVTPVTVGGTCAAVNVK